MGEESLEIRKRLQKILKRRGKKCFEIHLDSSQLLGIANQLEIQMIYLTMGGIGQCLRHLEVEIETKQ